MVKEEKAEMLRKVLTKMELHKLAHLNDSSLILNYRESIERKGGKSRMIFS